MLCCSLTNVSFVPWLIHDHDIAALHTAKPDASALVQQITVDMIVSQSIDTDLPTLAFGLLGLQLPVQHIEFLGQGFPCFQPAIPVMGMIDEIIGCGARNTVKGEPQNKTAESFLNNHGLHYATAKIEKVLAQKKGGPSGPPVLVFTLVQCSDAQGFEGIAACKAGL